jgi:hypothetical protein
MTNSWNLISGGNGLIDYGPVLWGRNRLFLLACSLQPEFFGLLNFLKGLLGGLAEGGAGLQIRYVRDVSSVLFRVENVYMVIFS